VRELFEKLWGAALKRISLRDRSRAELQEFLEALSKAEFESIPVEDRQAVIASVLEKLESYRYLDEARLAGALIRDQRMASRGPRAAWMKLKKRKIRGWSLEQVEQVWRAGSESFGAPPEEEEQDQARGEEIETARRWVVRRYPQASQSRTKQQKALAALVRRGYSFAVARQALQPPPEVEVFENEHAPSGDESP